PELLRAAGWRASRYGVAGELVDLERGELVPARALVDRLVERVGPELSATGDGDAVAALVDGLFARGTGADRQRAAYARRGRIDDVIDLVIRETAAVVSP
ncbi:carboxylate--amine ligase, partial [Frankia sp. AiPs1]|nr:carboxylate--amine ligase [Frankia sp. AiPs1]